VLCFGGNARERKAQALLGFPMRGRGEVRNEEWAVLEPLLRFRQRPDRRGRPPQDTRAVLNGVLWILRTGAQWRELPKMYPPRSDLSPAFSAMSAQQDKALRALARDSTVRGCCHWRKACWAALSPARKMGSSSGPTKARQGDENHGYRRCYQSSSGRTVE
jgi:transposase